jgi:hypothetical protein
MMTKEEHHPTAAANPNQSTPAGDGAAMPTTKEPQMVRPLFQ